MGLLANTYLVLVSHPSLPVRSVKQFTSFPAVAPHVSAGRLVALGAASPSRIQLAPEAPTLAESGVPGAETPTWYSLVAPAAIPPALIGRLRKEVAVIVATPDYREQLDRQGMELLAGDPGEFASFLRSEFDKWGGVIGKLQAR